MRHCVVSGVSWGAWREAQRREGVLDDFVGEFFGGVGGAAVAAGSGLGHVHVAGQEHQRPASQVQTQQIRERFDPLR